VLQSLVKIFVTGCQLQRKTKGHKIQFTVIKSDLMGIRETVSLAEGHLN